MNREIADVCARALVVANPCSANARRVGRQIRNMPIPVQLIETSRDFRITEESILSNAREGDLIMAAGGDGTSNQVLNVLMDEPSIELGIDGLPFLPLRGGNANDSAVMLNGLRRPDQILDEGRLCRVNPLEVTIGSDEQYSRRYAIGYFGVGATAAASKQLESIKGSSNALTKRLGLQLGREALNSFFAASRFEPFSVVNGHETPTILSEMLFLNGDRMAKVGRGHADLLVPRMEVIEENLYGVYATAAAMVKLATGNLSGQITHRSIFEAHSNNGPLVPVQYDGEVDSIRTGSTIAVCVSNAPFLTITTR